MTRAILISSLLCFGSGLFGAGDVVRLKDGGLRRGSIVSQEPGTKLTLEMKDGSRVVIQESDVESISKAESAPAEPEKPALSNAEPKRIPIEDLGQAVLSVKAAWGQLTGHESDVRAIGYPLEVQASSLGVKAGYEWDFIGVSLGFEYQRVLWMRGGGQPYDYTLAHSSDGMHQSMFIFPLMAEFYAPFGFFKPGLAIGGSGYFYDNARDAFGGINLIVAPILKFLVAKNWEIALDLRYVQPLVSEYDSYYGSNYDRSKFARWSPGLSVGLRL